MNGSCFRRVNVVRLALIWCLSLTFLLRTTPALAGGGAVISTVVDGVHSVGITADNGGNLYYMSFVDSNQNSYYINKRTTDGNVYQIAGGGTLSNGGYINGQTADKALIGNAWKIVPYNGDIYFSDPGNMYIRQISDNKVYNVVGAAVNYSDPDGELRPDLTRISTPRGLAVDATGFYFSEYEAHKVRVVFNGYIRTVAGVGVAGYSGDGGPASAAQLNHPSGIARDDSGNLYIADLGNNTIREVAATTHRQFGIDMQSGNIYTIAGNSSGSDAGDGNIATSAQLAYPRDVIVDGSGNLYISELHRVRKVDTNNIITTVAGSSTSGYSGDNGDASQARLSYPNGLALDASGNLLIADTQNDRIRKVSFSSPAPPLTVTTTALPEGTVGAAYSTSLAASGGTESYTAWSATGLPSGLSINTATGEIYGTPAVQGTFSVDVTVMDNSGSQGCKSMPLTIKPSGNSDSLPLNWGIRYSGTTGNIDHISYGNNVFIVTTNNGSVISSSDGGNSWSECTGAEAVEPHSITYVGNQFIAAGKGIMVSADGVLWNNVLPGTYHGTAFSINAIRQESNILLATGTQGTIFESNDGGATWHKIYVPNPNPPDFDKFIYVPAEDRFVGLAGGTIYTLSKMIDNPLYTSVSSHSDSVNTPYFKSLSYLDGKYYAVKSAGETDVIMTSIDLITWTPGNPISSTVNQILYDGPSGNKAFVAVGSTGTILISQDGAGWIPQASVTTNTINCIAYYDGKFIAVGDQGTILASADGMAWSVCNSGTTRNLYSIGCGNSTFIVGGVNQTILQPCSASSLTIDTVNLPAGVAGTPYAPITLEANGGTPPYTWSASWLPEGLSINSSSGVISGTPAVMGTYNVSISVADSSGNTAFKDLNLTIRRPQAQLNPPTNLNASDPDSIYSGVDGRDFHVSWTPSISQAVTVQLIYILPRDTDVDVSTQTAVATFDDNTTHDWTGNAELTMDSADSLLTEGNYRIYVVAKSLSLSAQSSTDMEAVSDSNTPAQTTFSVIFDSQGGSLISGINNITSGSAIRAPLAPTWAGHTFGGWYKESACSNAWDFNTDTVTNNFTLYAKWTNSNDSGGNSSKGGGSASTPTSTSTSTTVTGEVINAETGQPVKGIKAQATNETNGTITVALKAAEAVVIKQPDGTTSPVSDLTKLGFSATANINSNVTLLADGTIQVKGLAHGTESHFVVTYDLGNGQAITIGTLNIKVGSNGEVVLTCTLIDPYGIITDPSNGKPIVGANVTLYYALTDRNKAAGKTPDTVVQLPKIDGFKPNNNQNPQVSDASGAYGFMVFPTSDYYILATKEGYETYKSPTISVEQDIVKWDFKMNQSVKGVKRLSGTTRVDTALEIAKANYSEKLSNVVLATAENYPDALAGSVLAYQLNAPILLVGSTEADQEKILAYLKTNLDSTGTVYILGGTAVVSADVEAKVTASGFNHIVRLGGTDRYETAVKIADQLGIKTGTPIVLVYGENYADALSISSSASIMQTPILLVQKDGLSDAVKQKIAEIKPTKIYIIGGEGVINKAVERQVEQITLLDKTNIVRISGVDRYETSLAVAQYFNLAGQSVCIATGNNFPDALAGSVYAANFNAPIILVDASLSDQVMNYLKARTMTGATLFGGEAVVSKDIEQQLGQLIGK